MPGSVEVDVATVAVGELHNRADGVFVGDIYEQVGAATFSELQASLVAVDGDQGPRMAQMGTGHHAQPDRAYTGHNHDVVEADVTALDGVQRTRKGLRERSVSGR